MFLLVPAHPGSPGQRAVKQLLCVSSASINCSLYIYHYKAPAAENVPHLLAFVVVSFNRRLIICRCQAGCTQRGMVRQLMTSL